jgi:hypothetical protein
MRKGGNSSKLGAARTLLRVIASVFAGKNVFTLVDNWYINGHFFILYWIWGFRI